MKKLFLISLLMIGLALQTQAQLLQDLQYWRPYDRRGINMFETPKNDTVVFDGTRLRIGGSFALQYQNLSHSNTALPNLNGEGVNLNGLADIGGGFNLATANLNLDVMLADGVRLNIITYLSSRHHPDAWVKGGYLQFDKLPFLPGFDKIMEKVTLRFGHFEINYGDAHFRRTDNALAMYNPFIGNYIMDAFTTEIGGEIVYQSNGFLALAALTAGEINGTVASPDRRSPAFYGKVGYDKQINDELRLRLTGSLYTTSKSSNNTLFGGDRAGSRYYNVMVNSLTSVGSSFTTGRFNPGLRNNITSWVINPFVKFGALEIFGNFEKATGAGGGETSDREWDQLGIDLVYRMGANENFYVAGRYNTVSGLQSGSATEVEIKRVQLGMGYFLSPNILFKFEYVDQHYNDFAQTDILSGGEFNGIMFEGVISF